MINNPIIKAEKGGTIRSTTLSGSGYFTGPTGRTLNKDMFVRIDRVRINGAVYTGSEYQMNVNYTPDTGQLVVREPSNSFFASQITVFYID